MFTGMHGAVLAVIFGITALAIALARRAPLPAGPTAAERAVGIAYIVAWVTTYLFLLFPPLHDPPKTYPLQLCHWNALAAALLLATRWNALRPIVYFWGFALSTQAMITPSLTEGPAIYAFWFFWSTHGIIIGVALYEVFARGYRPTPRDYGSRAQPPRSTSRSSCRSISRSTGTTASSAAASRRCAASSMRSARGRSASRSSSRSSPARWRCCSCLGRSGVEWSRR
jgi:hypothetical protein